MIDAIDYKTIVEAVNEGLNSQPIRLMVVDSVEPAAREIMAEVNSKTRKHSLVAILFCNPSTAFCKSEILGSLSYFHHRSKQAINIFCCGYGAYWPEEKYPDLVPAVKIDGEQWYYSDNALVAVLEEFEKKTKWKFSGENELLLLDVSPSANSAELKINNALVCNLEQMKRDKAFTSVRSFFEGLIRYCTSSEYADAFAFSDKQGLNIAKNALKDCILGLLPKSVQSSYRKAESFAIRKI